MEKQSLDSPLIIGCVDSANGIEELRGRRRRRETWDEVKKQFWLAGPLIGASLLQKVLQLISVMFVGHLGELSLAGASMATSFAGVTGFSFLLGMGSALETLCGQSFGAQQYNVLGIHLQNAMLVLTLVSIPVAVLWCYTSQILVALGQDLEISLEAGLYARWLIPALFAYGLLQCQTRFLQTQNIVFPLLCASGVTTLLHILVCWLLVFKSCLGNKGAALANSISYWINVLLLSLFIKLSPSCKKTWDGFSKEIFSGTLDFIKLAIPSVSMVCMEYWSFELLVLLSGLLPHPVLETSVLSICLNTASLLFMIPYGLGAAISTRVSNELGAGRAQAARLAVHVVVLLAILESLIVGIILVLMRNIWGYAYNREDEVVKYVAIMVPVLAVSNVFDGIQCVLSGTARGCGLQKACAFANLGAYYVVGVPSAVLFAFALHIGGMGLWMGIICGLIVQVLLLLSITLSIDWEKETIKARHRALGSSIPVDMQHDCVLY